MEATGERSMEATGDQCGGYHLCYDDRSYHLSYDDRSYDKYS